MGEPRVLILEHSFIRRLNSFITDSTHIDGVHLNKLGYYKYYRRLRGPI